jgi:hypothetical protein
LAGPRAGRRQPRTGRLCTGCATWGSRPIPTSSWCRTRTKP